MVPAGLVVVAMLGAAQPVQGYRPIETQSQAWQRQQAQDYQARQANPFALSPRPEPLGDPRVAPPSGFNSFGQPQWNNPGSSAPRGTGQWGR